jgi:hypothetical protein
MVSHSMSVFLINWSLMVKKSREYVTRAGQYILIIFYRVVCMKNRIFSSGFLCLISSRQLLNISRDLEVFLPSPPADFSKKSMKRNTIFSTRNSLRLTTSLIRFISTGRAMGTNCLSVLVCASQLSLYFSLSSTRSYCFCC